MRLSLASKLVGLLLITGCLAVGGGWYYALSKLRVGGPIYTSIILSKDLIADILPPPEYIIEAYLETTLALNEPASIPARREKLNVLKKDYLSRHEYWKGAGGNEDIVRLLTIKADAPAQAFWSMLETDFLPALEAGELEKARAVYVRLTELYGQHRKLIDEVVTAANALSATTESKAADDTKRIVITISGVSVVLLAVILGSVGAISLGFVRPIERLRRAMTDLSAGKLDAAIPFVRRDDEIGEMARAVLVFRDSGLENQRLEREAEHQRTRNDAERAAREAEKEMQNLEAERFRQLSDAERRTREREKVQQAEQAHSTIEILEASLAQLAAGNLQNTIETPFAPTFERIRLDFNAAVGTLRHAIAEIVTSSRFISDTTEEITRASDSLARRTETQANILRSSSAATKELSVAVDQAADSSTKTKDVISEAKRDSEVGATVVRHTISAMDQIRDSSHQISKIIGVVDDIAFQTNLLALNAGVEAARAGETGRGFAVVASEVRALAQRTAEAAKEIKTLISRSSEQVNTGYKRVAETGDAIEHIMSRVTLIDGGIAEIAIRAIEQASTLKQVSTSITEIDQTTQQNASMAEEVTAACHALNQESARLVKMLGKFNVGETNGASPRIANRSQVNQMRVA